MRIDVRQQTQRGTARARQPMDGDRRLAAEAAQLRPGAIDRTRRAAAASGGAATAASIDAACGRRRIVYGLRIGRMRRPPIDAEGRRCCVYARTRPVYEKDAPTRPMTVVRPAVTGASRLRKVCMPRPRASGSGRRDRRRIMSVADVASDPDRQSVGVARVRHSASAGKRHACLLVFCVCGPLARCREQLAIYAESFVNGCALRWLRFRLSGKVVYGSRSNRLRPRFILSDQSVRDISWTRVWYSSSMQPILAPRARRYDVHAACGAYNEYKTRTASR